MAIEGAPHGCRADASRATFATRMRLCLGSATLVAALCLPGCATTGYRPRGTGSFGYEHSEVGPDTFEVRYRARLLWGKFGSQYQQQMVLDQLRRRCAELTLERGYDYFIVLREAGKERQTLGGTLEVLPLNMLGGAIGSSRYAAAATIRCFHGETPSVPVDEQGQPQPAEGSHVAWDARAVLAKIDGGRDK